MDKIKDLLTETRKWRAYYRSDVTRNHMIESTACAIRERALKDALIALGMDKNEVEKL